MADEARTLAETTIGIMSAVDLLVLAAIVAAIGLLSFLAKGAGRGGGFLLTLGAGGLVCFMFWSM